MEHSWSVRHLWETAVEFAASNLFWSFPSSIRFYLPWFFFIHGLILGCLNCHWWFVAWCSPSVHWNMRHIETWTLPKVTFANNKASVCKLCRRHARPQDTLSGFWGYNSAQHCAVLLLLDLPCLGACCRALPGCQVWVNYPSAQSSGPSCRQIIANPSESRRIRFYNTATLSMT